MIPLTPSQIAKKEAHIKRAKKEADFIFDNKFLNRSFASSNDLDFCLFFTLIEVLSDIPIQIKRRQIARRDSTEDLIEEKRMVWINLCERLRQKYRLEFSLSPSQLFLKTAEGIIDEKLKYILKKY